MIFSVKYFHLQIRSIIFTYQGILSKKIHKKVLVLPQLERGGVGHFVVGTTQNYLFFYVAPKRGMARSKTTFRKTREAREAMSRAGRKSAKND